MSYRLKLIKALSYCGVVKATREHPEVLVKDKATAEKAVATGYFKLLDGEAAPEPPKDPEPGKTLDEMTVPELETFAAYKNVSLKGVTKRADIIAKLKEELEAEETEGEVDYGSPTIVDLQEQK